MATLAGLGAFGSFLDDLCDAFDDDDVLGAFDQKNVPEPVTDASTQVSSEEENNEQQIGKTNSEESADTASSRIGTQGKGDNFIDLEDSRGLQVKFDIKGDKDAPKLLYIPGVTDDLRKTLSTEHCNAFAKQFRVLTCDLRNQGETTPFIVDKYVTLETYVEDLMALVNHIFAPEEKFHVAGWSFGGALALLMARLYPSRVRSVAVLAGGYWEPQEAHVGTLSPGGEALFGKDWSWIKTLSTYVGMSTEARCSELLQYGDVRRSDSTYREKMLPSFDFHLDYFVRSEAATVLRSPRSATELGEGVMLQEIALFAEGTAHLDTIATPTIIVHGRHDGMHSVDRAVALKKRMNSAMLVILEDEGHVVVKAAVDTASTFMLPQTIVHRRIENTPHEWSYDCANAALEEIAAAYKKDACQKKLDAVFERPGLTEQDKESECHRICLVVQGPILEKWGLPDPTRAAKDAFDNCDWKVNVMSRRRAALEKMAVVDRKKAFEKRLTDIYSKTRSELYSQQKVASKIDTKSIPEIGTEDYIRLLLQMSAPQQVNLKSHAIKPDAGNLAGYGRAVPFERSYAPPFEM